MNRMPGILTLVAAAVLLVFPATRAISPQGVSFAIPEVPPAELNKAFAIQWRFLNQARHVVPEGTSFTVRADDPDMEMSLFMFSLGVLVDQQPLPSSYFGGRRPDGDDAGYILALAPFTPQEPGIEVVARFREGTVYRRPNRTR